MFKAAGHPDELGDEREPVSKGKIGKREPSPERAEGIEDSFGMTSLRHRAQPHCHLLDEVCYWAQYGQEPYQIETVSGPGDGIGGDPPASLSATITMIPGPARTR